MRPITIQAVFVSLNMCIASGQEQGVGRDSVTLNKEKQVALEAQTVRMLTSKISDWETFKFPNDMFPKFEFRYPDGLNLELHYGIGHLLYHSIPFEHSNPCVFSDEPAPPLKELFDFRIQLNVLPRGLKSALSGFEGPASLDFLMDDSLKVMPGYVDKISIGSLKCYRIASGVEGCGYYNYYFPLNKSHTLVIKRYYITELNPIISNYREYRKLPGVIFPDEEERLFNMIISTFRFLE